jgi:hypothetical protein
MTRGSHLSARVDGGTHAGCLGYGCGLGRWSEWARPAGPLALLGCSGAGRGADHAKKRGGGNGLWLLGQNEEQARKREREKRRRKRFSNF